ncbi:MAG: hypothetical protein ACXADW_15815 [Candidatus Hodarchaeales archaeon]
MASVTQIRMSVDKDKVNSLLLEFQKLLKTYRPNKSELQLITSKITKMTEKNISGQQSRGLKSKPRKSNEKPPSTDKKWVKIKID